MRTQEAGSPFKCETCTEDDKGLRNCFNRKGLSDEARAVLSYTDEIKEELKRTGARKVGVTMGDMRLYECPLSYITDETWQMMRAVFLVDGSQQLYFSGGWADQPHWFIEALEIYRAEIARRKPVKEDKGKNGGKKN